MENAKITSLLKGVFVVSTGMEITKSQLEFLRSKGLNGYKPHQKLCVEKNRFTIKVAETDEELVQTFALRYEIYGEFYKVKPSEYLDIDGYDKHADHIIVIDNKSKEILGTYRVLCSDFVNTFYTEREFLLQNLKSEGCRLVEMGRATVSSKSRSGVVINLLWRGLGDYIKKLNADYLIGCATFWTQDFNEVARACKYFKTIGVISDKEVVPLDENIIPGWEKLVQEQVFTEKDLEDYGKGLPPLVKSYIKAGTKFGFNPANDEKLQSIDFFSICKISEMTGSLVKKYL